MLFIIFVLVDDIVDHRFAEPHLVGDFAAAETLLAEFENADFGFTGFRGIAVTEMFFFGGEFTEIEAQKAAFFVDFIDEDVPGIVAESPCPDLDLLDITEVLALSTLTDGKYGVEKVVEFLASGKVILGNRTGKISLWCVGDD